ncbi:MAG: hypothetical protein COW54_05560 [Rhodobacteraceae bacterium CG17_big_fil_post_rev_8_21_14_2_50_63_15]|nr:hypothetical protein [Roseovarius sp.]PIV79179.1 MAG: hypothetical protein COW54_05560 [Rhodobacteraceae bacterium CG17_big_fil_post_rev_8_21_14_2_50_63_15]
MIADFRDEILGALSSKEIKKLKDNGSWEGVWLTSTVAALYLARFWTMRNPWWADEALQELFSVSLPVTKAVSLAHFKAMQIRKQNSARELGQMLRRYEDQKLKDVAFVQIETMRQAGIPLSKACSGIALWLDRFSKGSEEDREILGIKTVPKRMWKVETLVREAPRWRDDWLRGKVWAVAIKRDFAAMDESTRRAHGEKLLSQLEAIGPADGHFRGQPR